jgi:hypothetical protein
VTDKLGLPEGYCHDGLASMRSGRFVCHHGSKTSVESRRMSSPELIRNIFILGSNTPQKYYDWRALEVNKRQH